MRRIAAFAVLAGLAVAAPGLAGSTTSVPRCQAGQLRIAATFYGVAGGQFIQTFTLTNATRQACRLRGWPRLSLESGSGRPLRTSSVRVRQGAPGAPAFRTVALRPRGVGAFDVYGADWNAVADESCPRTTAVLITPPGARSAISVPVKIPNCGRFYVAPVIAGSADRQSWSEVWHG